MILISATIPETCNPFASIFSQSQESSQEMLPSTEAKQAHRDQVRPGGAGAPSGIQGCSVITRCQALVATSVMRVRRGQTA
jgi:hypothetical protein